MRVAQRDASASTSCTGSGSARLRTARNASISSHSVTLSARLRVRIGRHALGAGLAGEDVAAQQRPLGQRLRRLAVALVLEQLAHQIGARVGLLVLLGLAATAAACAT